MGIDPGILFPFGDHVGPDGNLKAGGKGILRYLYPFGNNVDANGNVNPRGGGKPADGYYGPGGNPSGSGQGQAQQNPGMGPYQGLPSPETPEVSAPTRDVQKVNGAKGTQTSPGGGRPLLTAADAAKFYQDRNIGGFMSNQLPGQRTNPFSGTTIEAVPFGGQEQSVTTNTLGAYSVNGQAYAALDPTKPGAGYNPQAPTIEGGSQRINQTPGVTPGNGKGSNRLNAALNDTAGIQSYMSKFGSPEQDRMRSANMAFLNAKGSMEGLRAKEAVLGQIYAGGETYQLNEDRTQLIQDKNNEPIAANKENTRAYKSGNMSAGDYRESFKGAVMQQNTQTPATSQNPTALNPVPVSKQPTNTNFGPIADSEQTGRMLESLKGMKGVGPFIDGPTYGEFLEGNREPLMRDPRKK